MKSYIKRMTPVALAAVLIFSSCSESKTNTVEQAEINTMDSTAQALKETTDNLEEQTRKVEESLEKLDSEFKPEN